MKIKSSTKKRLIVATSVVAVAAAVFCVCSLALDPFSVTSKIGMFSSGNEGDTSQCNVDINGGTDIFDEDFIIEPGMTITKEFYITNNDESNVWYGFEGDDGVLSKTLDITIVSDDVTLYDGKAADLENFNSDQAKTIVPNDTKNFTVTLHYPESAMDNTQNKQFDFTVFCDFVTA